MAELRAGGLALVVGLKSYSHYNGRCVLLHQKVKKGDIFKSPINEQLWIEGDEGETWIVTGDITHPEGGYGWASFDPRNLLPIDGEDFSHEGERKKELTHG